MKCQKYHDILWDHVLIMETHSVFLRLLSAVFAAVELKEQL